MNEVEQLEQSTKRERTFSFTENATKADPVLRTVQRTIYTAGRPPWYDAQGQSQECFIIGMCLSWCFDLLSDPTGPVSLVF